MPVASSAATGTWSDTISSTNATRVQVRQGAAVFDWSDSAPDLATSDGRLSGFVLSAGEMMDIPAGVTWRWHPTGDKATIFYLENP